MFKLIISIPVVAMILFSCSTSSKQDRDKEYTSLGSKERYGHLYPKDDRYEDKNRRGGIPGTVKLNPLLDLGNSSNNPLQYTPMLSGKRPKKYSRKVYSVAAMQVSVKEILFKLATDAKRQLSLDPNLKGKVTLFMENSSLDDIVKNIAEQVGAVYSLTSSLIKVTTDSPYWETYRLNYVNLKKTSKDSVRLNLSVTSAASIGDNSTNSTGGDDDTTNGSSMTVTSTHEFWETIKKNLQSLIRDRNSTSKDKGKEKEDTRGIAMPVDSNERSGSGNPTVIINKEAGLVAIYAKKIKHKHVKSFIKTVMDRTSRQVLIEATVVEIELSDKYQAGVDWSALTDSANLKQNVIASSLPEENGLFSATLVGDLFSGVSTSVAVKMLNTFGKSKVLSSPKIMAINNQMSILKVVQNSVYFTVTSEQTSSNTTNISRFTYSTEVKTVPVGFMMSVTPFVSGDDEVILNIRPTLSKITAFANDPNPDLAAAGVSNRIPIIQEREMSSVLRLKDRQTAVIGGLIQDSSSGNRRGIPYLSAIPFIGALFSYRETDLLKTELVIFIKPIIIKRPDINRGGNLQELRPFLPSKHRTY